MAVSLVGGQVVDLVGYRQARRNNAPCGQFTGFVQLNKKQHRILDFKAQLLF